MALRQRCLGLVAGALKAASLNPALSHATPASVPAALAPGSAPRGWVLRSCLGSLRPFSSGLPEHTELTMPALSPTMEKGNILEWKKKVGDSVAPGDVYCEVETDKASMDWESQEEGYVAKIVLPDNSKDIPVGQVVAVLVEDEKDIPAFADWQPGATPAAAAPLVEKKEEAKPSKKPASGKSWPPHDILAMPALSPTMEQGNILEWKKKEGDTVVPGDVWAEVETDKASMDWESQEDGVVAKILVPSGAQAIKVGQPVVVLVEEGADIAPFKDFTAEDAGISGEEPATVPAEEPKTEAVKPAPAPEKKTAVGAPAKSLAPGERVVASPYAKKLAAEANVSLAGVAGSGEGGRIVAADVRELIASGGGKAEAEAEAAAFEPVESGAFTDIPHSQIRRITAQRLLASKQNVPHYYLTVSMRVDELLALRKRLNADLAAQDAGKLSVNDFVIKAAALTLRKFPDVNASWHDDFIRRYADVDVSVAVQTQAGLMVPIVRDADLKGLSAISTDVKTLAAKAKEGKLRPEEFTGGTFTISNLGMFGVKQFAAIINPPQSCILAVGAAQPRVVRRAAGEGFEEAQVLEVTLSCDHRVVDGALGAQWLQVFKRYMENPSSMLL